ncbi:MAG TPA: IS1595 family transposase, partial [Candidatus Saccharimonadales bacterium]|nr:IS1595 family transposase [Candidatus Saccharimonadales bacterium]
QGERAQDRIGPVADKAAVFSMLQRGGKVYSQHVERVTAENLQPIVQQMITEDAKLISDTGVVSRHLGQGREHHLVNHSNDEYVRWEEGFCVTTNTIEGFFSLLKRGINGVYHQVGRKHLHRYLSEFDFRYNNRKVTDGERAQLALKGFDGKRLTYKGSDR